MIPFVEQLLTVESDMACHVCGWLVHYNLDWIAGYVWDVHAGWYRIVYYTCGGQ